MIGHSQGELLTKLIAIDSETTFWDGFSSEPVKKFVTSSETQKLLQKSFFFKPLPFVNRVVFIATPQYGSYVAGSWFTHQFATFVKLPARLVSGLTEVVTQDNDALKLDRKRAQSGSVYAMATGSSLIIKFVPLQLAKENFRAIGYRGEE